MSNDNFPSAPAIAIAAPQTTLETRVMTRRTELISELVFLKADLTIEGAETRGRLETRLSKLGRIIEEGVIDGWTTLSTATASQLDQWLVENHR
jgi:hypothetical protein